MVLEQVFRFVFVLYCTTVGAILLIVPWLPKWDWMVVELPVAGLRMLGIPVLRGALSGFGLVHLVWGIHDLSALLRAPHDPPDSPLAGDR